MECKVNEAKRFLRLHIEEQMCEPEQPRELMDEIERRPYLLGEKEFEAIYKDHHITDDEFEEALDTIITHMMQRQLHTINVDLAIRNKIIEERNKPLEISLKELSRFFGNREIKIVEDSEESSEEVSDDRSNESGTEPNRK